MSSVGYKGRAESGSKGRQIRRPFHLDAQFLRKVLVPNILLVRSSQAKRCQQGAALQDDGEPPLCGGRGRCRSGLGLYCVGQALGLTERAWGKEHPLTTTNSDRACCNNIGKVLVVASPRKK